MKRSSIGGGKEASAGTGTGLTAGQQSTLNTVPAKESKVDHDADVLALQNQISQAIDTERTDRIAGDDAGDQAVTAERDARVAAITDERDQRVAADALLVPKTDVVPGSDFSVDTDKLATRGAIDQVLKMLAGAVEVRDAGSYPANPYDGQIANRTDLKSIERFNGGVWVPMIDAIEDLREFATAVGQLNNGITLLANNDLTTRLTSGNLVRYDQGLDRFTNTAIAAEDPFTFDYVDRDGNILSAGNTSFDFTQFHDGTDFTPITGNDASVQPVFVHPDGRKWAMYGHTFYSSFNIALERYSGNPPPALSAAFDGFQLIKAIIGRTDTVSLDSNRANLLDASKIGELTAIGSSPTEAVSGTRYYTAPSLVDRLSLPGLVVGDVVQQEDTEQIFRVTALPVTDPDNWSGDGTRYLTPSGDSQLQTGRYHRLSSGTHSLPPTPQDGDCVVITNLTTLASVPGEPLMRPVITGPIRAATGTDITAFEMGPGFQRFVIFDASIGRWMAPTDAVPVVFLDNTNSGQELRANGINVIAGDVAGMVFRAPLFTIGTLNVRLASSSIHDVTIEQFDTGANAHFLVEDGTVSREMILTVATKGENTEFLGLSTRDRWAIQRPSIQRASESVIWHTAESDQALVRQNIYPQGSDLALHTPPAHVAGGSYSILTGDQATGVVNLDQIDYISNGIAGAGGAWLDKRYASSDQPWRALTDYKVGDTVTQSDLSDGVLYIYSWSDAVNNADVDTDGTSGATWDPTEEARWVKVGEATANLGVLQSVEVTVKGYATSFTIANALVLVDKDGNDYDSNTDWIITNDSAGTLGDGRLLGTTAFAPATNASRTLTLSYVGPRTRRGLSAIRANFRTSAASTGFTRVFLKYFSGITAQAARTGGQQAAPATWDFEDFDFLTDPQQPNEESQVISPDDVSEWSEAEIDIELGALRKFNNGSEILILGRIVDDATADGGTIPDGAKWEDITAVDPDELQIIDTDAIGGSKLVLFGVKYQFTGSTPTNIITPGDGGINENTEIRVYNKSTAVLTVTTADSVVIPAGPNTGATIVADAGVDGPQVVLFGGATIETGTNELAVVRYTADGAIQDFDHKAIFETGAVNMTLSASTVGRVIQMVSEGPTTVVTADGTEQFTGSQGTSADSKLTINQAFKWATIIGRTAGGWSQYVGQAGIPDGVDISTPTTFKAATRLVQNGVENSASITFPTPFKTGTIPSVLPVPFAPGDNQSVTIQSVDHLGFTVWVVRNESDVGIASPTIHWSATGEPA